VKSEKNIVIYRKCIKIFTNIFLLPMFECVTNLKKPILKLAFLHLLDRDIYPNFGKNGN